MIAPVLYVEDEENDAIFMQRAFRSAGLNHPLLILGDGRQALEYLEGRGAYSDRERYPLPILVLLDLKLPHMPGLEILKWIRSHAELKTLSVVVLASSTEDAQIEAAQKLGATSYLVKPPTSAGLIELVKSLGLIETNRGLTDQTVG
jgi:CheY-like chemotaxis protein